MVTGHLRERLVHIEALSSLAYLMQSAHALAN